MEFETLQNILTEQLGIDKSEISMDTSIVDDLGVDSLDFVELVMAVDQEFDIEINDSDVDGIVTIGDVVNYIKEKTQ